MIYENTPQKWAFQYGTRSSRIRQTQTPHSRSMADSAASGVLGGAFFRGIFQAQPFLRLQRVSRRPSSVVEICVKIIVDCGLLLPAHRRKRASALFTASRALFNLSGFAGVLDVHLFLYGFLHFQQHVRIHFLTVQSDAGSGYPVGGIGRLHCWNIHVFPQASRCGAVGPYSHAAIHYAHFGHNNARPLNYFPFPLHKPSLRPALSDARGALSCPEAPCA